jgi:hypothetical protein
MAQQAGSFTICKWEMRTAVTPVTWFLRAHLTGINGINSFELNSATSELLG